MFDRRWTWLVPLLGAAAAFGGVLLSTPPGFGAIRDVVLGSARGPGADAAAYVLGSASCLALVVLLALAGVVAALDLVRRSRAASKR